MEKKQNEIRISLKLQGIDEVTEKLERYVQLLKETKTLADELASLGKYYKDIHGLIPEKISLVAEGRSQLSFGKYTVSRQLFPYKNEVWGANQAAEYLDIGPQTLKKEAAKGNIPGVKVGDKWRFSSLALYKYLNGDLS